MLSSLVVQLKLKCLLKKRYRSKGTINERYKGTLVLQFF